MENFIIYSSGLCFMAVCVSEDMTTEEIVHQANLQSPTGISSKWDIHKEDFKDGTSNPCDCDTTQGRKHYLLSC